MTKEFSIDKTRELFLNFFKDKGHEIVPSSPLILPNDPTLLFANAGMNQFKGVFLGEEKRPYTRAASCQVCLRITGKHNDLENVGVTARHHTLFEMLGNFSFGDYFKESAIEYAWELVTEIYRLDKERIWVSVFREDEETARLWEKIAGVSPSRIIRLGESENFWAMGDTGPCGPCTELHYYIGDNVKNQRAEDLERGDPNYLEFWNLVFMEFNRDSSGRLDKLPKQCVDTGMGLERITSILQGKRSNYDTDYLRAIISFAEDLTGLRYDGADYTIRDKNRDAQYARDVAFRVIADHSRACAFLVAEGVIPSSDGRGYVLRRLIRRAVRFGRVLGLTEPFFFKCAAYCAEIMGHVYPHLKDRVSDIEMHIKGEETRFNRTIESGMSALENERKKLRKGEKFPGEKAFLLHDTYGFPLDLTSNILRDYGIEVDEEKFNECMSIQRARAREDRKKKGIEFKPTKLNLGGTNFIGYSNYSAETEIVGIEAVDKGLFYVALKETPFYAEAGGQVGDVGKIFVSGGSVLDVIDTQKTADNTIIHMCSVIEGEFSEDLIGSKVTAEVDKNRREKIAVHHSATHLLNAALRNVLGNHVRQAGSKVDDFGFRFDFTHGEPISKDTLLEIQSFVNEEIRKNHEVITRVMPIEEARKTGAIAIFGEKYGDIVRVVQIGEKSLEFCGGTHVKRSGDCGFALITYEGGISAGIRRIECVAGANAAQEVNAIIANSFRMMDLLKAPRDKIYERVEQVAERVKELEGELRKLRKQAAVAKARELISRAQKTDNGITVVAEKVSLSDTDELKTLVDEVRARLRTGGVVVLAGGDEKRPMVVAGVTKDLTDRVSAGNIIKTIAPMMGARGGGKADFAQAGGGDIHKVESALKEVHKLVNA